VIVTTNANSIIQPKAALSDTQGGGAGVRAWAIGASISARLIAIVLLSKISRCVCARAHV
jgi:hypothetical protein